MGIPRLAPARGSDGPEPLVGPPRGEAGARLRRREPAGAAGPGAQTLTATERRADRRAGARTQRPGRLRLRRAPAPAPGASGRSRRCGAGRKAAGGCAVGAGAGVPDAPGPRCERRRRLPPGAAPWSAALRGGGENARRLACRRACP